jgi:hypothetical protein
MDAVRKLDEQERQIRILRQKQYRTEGHTEAEAEWLASHSTEKRFSELPKRQQTKLSKEMDQMFASIPPEFRERAKELSGY